MTFARPSFPFKGQCQRRSKNLAWQWCDSGGMIDGYGRPKTKLGDFGSGTSARIFFLFRRFFVCLFFPADYSILRPFWLHILAVCLRSCCLVRIAIVGLMGRRAQWHRWRRLCLACERLLFIRNVETLVWRWFEFRRSPFTGRVW